MWKRAVCVCWTQFLRQSHGEVAPQVTQAMQLHASCTYRYPHSGDHGPERNYMKKIAKKKRKIEGTGSGGEILGIDARGMLKDSSERVDPEQGQKPTGREKEVKREIPDISAILQGFRKVEKQQPSGTKREREDRVTFEQLLSEVKVHIPAKEVVQNQLGFGRERRVSKEPKLKGSRGTALPTRFMDPSAGKRLGIFEHPKPGQKVMPLHEPTLAEQDEAKRVRSLMRLKPRTYFEEMMEQPKYPRHFPIDNEDYRTEEHSVGFEDHVLIDHLLEGFPTRGPVRHFMELVVAGLSKNPNYTAKEKREYVQRYKAYFDQFTPEELQSVTVARKESASQ